jgi:hypothetical protein
VATLHFFLSQRRADDWVFDEARVAKSGDPAASCTAKTVVELPFLRLVARPLSELTYQFDSVIVSIGEAWKMAGTR